MRAIATEIVRRLQSADFAAYFVGGCVRDQLLGQEPEDYDIASSARPEEVEALFPHSIPVGRKFGVLLVMEGVRPFNLATFRADAVFADGSHTDRVNV